MNLTLQQRCICDGAVRAANAGGHIKIIAGAGTGKTSTLISVAKALRAADAKTKILYLAYNRPIMLDARNKFSGLSDVFTLHSLAYRMLSIHKQRERIDTLYPKHIKLALKLPEYEFGLSDRQLARCLLSLLHAFCNSALNRPDPSMLPNGLKKQLGQEGADWCMDKTWKLLQFLSPFNPKGHKYPLPHDVYLKIWQLSGSPGVSEYSTVLLDEAQDANPLIIDTLARARHAVFVGDSHQQIYQFRGAVDAMTALPGEEYPLTQSFRWGQRIADLANSILAMKSVPPRYCLSGDPHLNTRIEPLDTRYSHARIYRTNSALVHDALAMQDLGRDPEVVGDRHDFVRLLRSLVQLQAGPSFRGRRVSHPALEPFDSWQDLQNAIENDDEISVDIRSAVNTIEDHGARLPELITLLERKSSGHRLQLTTAHKSKGLEWDQCLVVNDFDRILTKVKPNERDHELNLLYVATTRARSRLEIQSPYVQALL